VVERTYPATGVIETTTYANPVSCADDAFGVERCY
jgi:hypothetical protein